MTSLRRASPAEHGSDGQSFRRYLATLESTGELLTVEDPVDARYEVAACLRLLDTGPALRFTDVGGTAFPVVGNLLNSRQRIAAALGCPVAELADRIADSATSQLPPQDTVTAPWQEIVEQTDFGALPVPQFFEQETGAYLSAGVILARDVISGVRNMSYARFKILGPDTAMLGVSPNHHLGKMVARAASVGKSLPICVAVGNHPAVMIAACLYLGFGDDEAASAGSLLGAALHVTGTPTYGIPAPTGSEMVFEAEVLADDLVDEGTVSEFHGMYHEYGRGFMTRFGRLSRRADAVLQVVLPGLHQEHVLLGGVAIAAGLQARLRARMPNVTAVAVPDTGSGRTAAVIALRDAAPGHALQAILLCLGEVPLIKQVVVVDDDIDVWNTKAVEWARMTRSHPVRDLLVVPNARTDRSEPLHNDLTVDKLGIDATRKDGDRAEGFTLARPPVQAIARATELLASYTDGPAVDSLRAGIAGFWS